jgi:hypothetical protein
LHCPIQSGMAIDPDTGNHQPVKSIVDFTAFLTVQKNPPRDQDPPQPGNYPAYWCEGYICKQIDPLDPSNEDLPTQLPTNFIPAAIACEISGTVGRFTLVPRIEIAAIYNLGFSDLLGQPICGWFEIGGTI